MFTRFALSIIALLVAPLALAQSGDPQRGKTAAVVCTSCHQPDGSGKDNAETESWPRLAGLNAEYLARQLRDFKSGQRNNPTMLAFANMLDEQQILDVAAYYSQLPVPDVQGREATQEALALGRKLVKRGDWDRYIPPCVSCHGPQVQGVGAPFPALAGQHAGYIEQQLMAWRNGTRRNDPLHLMLAVAERMNEADIKAVAAWLSQQKLNATGGAQ